MTVSDDQPDSWDVELLMEARVHHFPWDSCSIKSLHKSMRDLYKAWLTNERDADDDAVFKFVLHLKLEHMEMSLAPVHIAKKGPLAADFFQPLLKTSSQESYSKTAKALENMIKDLKEFFQQNSSKHKQVSPCSSQSLSLCF